MTTTLALSTERKTELYQEVAAGYSLAQREIDQAQAQLTAAIRRGASKAECAALLGRVCTLRRIAEKRAELDAKLAKISTQKGWGQK
jgi:hypothetical protein